MPTAESDRRIIVALDVGEAESAMVLVRSLNRARTFKVGLKLFTSEGPAFLSRLIDQGKSVFLDLKLHDIPNTVAETVRVCVGYGIAMTTLHASGGREMMRRAAEAAAEESDRRGVLRPLLLAVTILTSLKGEHIAEIGMPPDTDGQVRRLARLARESGADGVVCSPMEIEIVKKEVGSDYPVVAPGIRPAWASADDQKRIMTPSEAVRKGADFIVIGRPIIAADSPAAAFDRIAEELESQ